jgi:hypothetical protein
MNLFRSEGHIRNWSGFNPEAEDGIISMEDLVKLFSCNNFRRRLDPDWLSHSREYGREMLATLGEMGKSGPFWKRPKQ